MGTEPFSDYLADILLNDGEGHNIVIPTIGDLTIKITIFNGKITEMEKTERFH